MIQGWGGVFPGGSPIVGSQFARLKSKGSSAGEVGGETRCL